MAKKIDYDLVYKDIIDNLKNLDTKTRLRYRRIESINKNEINVSFHGHEVGGSYVHDYEVTPKYKEDIEYSTNRQAIWTGRSSGDFFGSDTYFFTIKPKIILDNNKYVPKGEILRVENCSFAFEYEGGHTWALLYIFTRELKRKDNILNKFNIKINNNMLSVDNKDIAYIVKYEVQESYTRSGGNVTYNRTIFNAIFDILIKKNEIEKILCDKYKEIVDYYFKDKGECKSVEITRTENCGDRITITMKNKFKYDIGSDWYVLNDNNIKTIIDYYDNYISNIRHIVLPSGKDVEILNESELLEKMYRHNVRYFTSKDAVNMILKYDKVYDLSNEDINFLKFKLYRLYPGNHLIQSLVL
jgi:hypothetical protein